MEIAIQKGIPLPASHRSRAIWTNTMKQMEIGDSFIVTSNNEVTSVANAAKRLGYKVTSRREEDGKIRVWRIG